MAPQGHIPRTDGATRFPFRCTGTYIEFIAYEAHNFPIWFLLSISIITSSRPFLNVFQTCLPHQGLSPLLQIISLPLSTCSAYF